MDHPNGLLRALRGSGSRLGIRAIAAVLSLVVFSGWGLSAASLPATASMLATPVDPAFPLGASDDLAELEPSSSIMTPTPAPTQAASEPALTEDPTADEPQPSTSGMGPALLPVSPLNSPGSNQDKGLSNEGSEAESGRAPPVASAGSKDFRTTASFLAAGFSEAPRQVWTESFEQGLTNTASGLTAYSAGRYTGSAGWINPTSCTGVLLNYISPYPNPSFCPTQALQTRGQSSLAAREARRMADVLGQVAAGVKGSTSSQSPTNGSTASTQTNHALIALPYGAVTGGTTVLQSTAGIGITAPDSRYYALGMNTIGTQCGNNNASLSLNLVSGTTTLLSGFPTAVVPCTTTGNVFYTSPALPTLATVNNIADPAFSASVRAASNTGSKAALLTPAQISAAQVELVNTVTGSGSGFGVDNLRVLDVTPALDASFEVAGATSTVPTSLTYSITNTTDLLAKTDWGFSTALPPGLSVAPNPTVAGTCTNAAGTPFKVTATAGTASISAVGGDLVAGATSCTISVAVVAASSGTYTSGTVTPAGLISSPPDSLSVAAATTITVRKNLPSRTTATDQFTLTLRMGTSKLAEATTTGAATGIQASQISRSVVQPGSTYTIHEAPLSGAGLGYSNGYECIRAGTVIASGPGAAGTITVPDEEGAEIICTFTNTTQTPRLFCDTNHFYSINATGVLEQGDIVSGSVVPVGTWPGVTASNALGIGQNGNLAYALDRSSDASDVSSILKWTPGAGFQKLANTSYTTMAGGSQINGSIVAGAIDLASGRYLFGAFANSQFYLWSFTETNPAATRFAYVGAFPTGAAPNGNGDMAFDAGGNLYVVGAATANSTSSATIYTVTAETIAAASGGTLAVNTSATRPFVGTEAAFTNVNGIAFSPRGTVYLSNASNAYEFDATTWTRVNGTERIAINSVDLAGCSSPPTITVQKNVVGRQVAKDQFTLTASAGSPLSVFATATTTGSATGRQNAQIGPFPTQIGTTITISETMAAGSTSAINAYTTIYECWADGVRLSSGTTTTGAVTMPNKLSSNVNCTYFNSPAPVTSVRITKTIRDFSGLTRPGVDWSLGTTATATTGTATALPSESLRQQSNAAGQANWTVLFGSAASRATVVVSEVQQEGFAFVSGSCTVNGATRPVTFTQVGSIISASVTAIAPASALECTIINRPTASLTLVKAVTFGSALTTDWTLSAVGPAGALPGPAGRSGTAAASGVPVTPGVTYRLTEAGGPLTYVQTGIWQCRTGTGVPVETTPAGDLIPLASATITCTVTNATASITLLNRVQNPQPGFQAPDWKLTATPAPLTGGPLPTEIRPGADYVSSGNPANTFDVRPGHNYTLTEAATDPSRRLAYQEIRLEQLTGSTWTPVSARTISAPAPGQAAVYRFVNAPVEPTTLPLTGGTSADAFYIGGGSLLVLAFTFLLWHRRQRMRGAF
ncbi:LPXTG cell wall anchor domain-containing protein [Arthrobacter sp. lap29]|uniref:DUF7933 domain-containing protein n=1 Tax=Arthrobacter sp. lap29 TaxID=3056122 RepID=UPI0028F734E5|nr:LPXTG cell wall anchor domain-containing protein [Arthrobacter sp. lap29]